MRKIWKVLTLVALLSLIVCAVAISAFATEQGRVSELSSPWQYTASDGTVKTVATIAEAVSGAPSGSTIKLLCDQTVAHDSSIVSISKKLTVDLGGHTFKLSQSYQAYININTTSEVTFKNGTIVASGNSAFGKEGAGYAIFRNAKEGIKLTLENVNTYSAAILLSGWTNNPTLTINGGEHHIVFSEGHMYGGGLLESRKAATLNVNDAIVYLKTGAAVNAHSFNATATDKSINYTFTNCKIITDNGSRSIVGWANENTTITFNGCDIFGSINPSVSKDDANKGYKAIKDGAIVLGGGTRFASTAETPLCAQVVCKSGEGVIGIADSVEYNLKTGSGSLYYNTESGSLSNLSFKTISSAFTIKYVDYYGTVNDLAFSYGSLGKTYYTNDFIDAVAKCDTTINVNKPYTLELTNKQIAFTRDVTVDLRGNTLEIIEKGDRSMMIKEGVEVTIKNGNIIKRDHLGAPTDYSVFLAEEDNAALTLENVSVDASSLIMVYADGCKVNISGGTHGNYSASNVFAYGYIDMYAKTDVKIDDAIILVGDLPVFSSMSYDVTIELNDSRVFGDTADSMLVQYIEPNNKITINGCDIFASFDMFSSGSDEQMRGTIVLGERTRVSKLDAVDGMIVAKHGMIFAEKSVTETITYPTADGNYVSKTFTFEYVVDKPGEDAVATYISGNMALATDDIKIAFASASAGSEITLLKDISLIESEKAFIEIKTEGLTLNLGGHTLEVIQQGEASIDFHKNFKIKNGTIRAAMDYTVDESLRGKSYPVLRYGIGAKNVSLVLENVNTYAGTLIFAWDCSGHSLDVIGGRHHAQTRGTGCDNGWLDVRGDFKFKAEDAAFYINDNSYVISSLSFKDTDKTSLAASFDFVGCDIIAENGKSNAIGHANENSKFSFTDCDIYASINPTLNSNDANAGYTAIKAGAIVLGGGVRLSSVGTFISGNVITAANGCVMADVVTSGRVVYEGYSFVAETAHFVTEDKIVNASYSKSYERAEDLTVTVKWYKEDGVTLLREDKVTKGTVVTPPSYAPGISNGWYKTGYSGWSTSFASTVSVKDFTVTKNTSYYPCVSDAVTADLTVARYNLTLVGKVCNNLYLPVTPSGISIKGVFVNGVEIPKTRVVIDGNKYYMYTVSEVGAARLTTVTTVTVKYIAAGTELSATLSLRPSDYAEVLLKDAGLSSPVYSKSAHTLAADLVRYSNSLCLAVDGVEDSKLASLIKAYGSLASELVPSNSFAEYRANTTPLKGIIASIALEVSATEPRWVFNLAAGAKVSGIEVELEGFLPTVVDGINFGKVIYKAEKNEDTGAYFTEYIPIYNLDRLMIVRVMLEDGGYVEGKYSLNAYYNGFTSELGNDAEIKAFIKAFRTLGKSSSEYKYGTEIKTSNTIIDFFACDHDNIGSFYEAQGRYCPDCATYVFFYSDFGAVADGVSDRNSNASGTNNHQMMYMCHKAANEWKAAGNKTAVQAVGGAHNGTKYYIGKQYNKSSASIMTDTSWSGAEFIVDDRTVKIPDKDGFAIPVFRADVDQKKEWAINYNAYAPANGLASGSRNVGFAPGRPMMLQIVDKSRRNNIRQGANENTGESIHEMILVDEYGNISSDTPVEWDYYNVQMCKYGCTYVNNNGDQSCDTCGYGYGNSMTITGYAIDVDPITISGLDKDGNINFIWETITDNTVYIEHYTQCGRRFQVARSNVTVMGIDHYFTEDNTNETPRTAYAGVVNVTTCNNVTVKDMLVVQHISHAALDGVGQGSYEFSAGNACNINLIGYRAKNFFGAGGTVPSRGMFGTNYIRNFYVKDCVLTSFDSHSGAYNAVLEDSVFEHVNFVGGGNAYMKNCTVYVDSGRSACVLRQDYGSMWHGNIYFDGLKLRYSKSEVTCVDLVEASYTNWNFGTETYLPEEIIANNVVIERYSRSTEDYVVENGTLRENILGVNEVPLGIHHFLNKQLVGHIDYSTANSANLDEKHPTKRVEINNCGNIQIAYPDHTFFSGMEVYIDGVKQDWFNRRDTLLCEDFDGDYVCDVCKYEFTCSKSHPTSGTEFTKCTGCGNVRYIAPGESVVELKEAYEYTKGGNTVTAYSGTSLSDVIANADSGTTIKLLTDNTVHLEGTYNIGKNITIDLNGKILKVFSPASVAAYHIGNNKTLTWQNGTVICMVEGTEYTHGRPLTSLGTKSTVNYNNVTAFVSCLAYSYNSDNVTININGGEYYAIAQSDAGQASFIETRANVNFTAQDALFYLTNNSSYYLISGTNNYVDSGDKYNNYTFTNCDIIRNDKGNLVYYANEFTKIYLNECRIYGTLNNGNYYSSDKSQGTAASKSGMYVIGANTRLLKNKSGWFGSIGAETYIGTNATYAEGCSQSDSSKSITYTLKKISGTGDGISITTQSKSFSFTALVS